MNPSSPNSATGGTGSSASLTITTTSNGWTANRNQGTQLSSIDSIAAAGSGYSANDIITLVGGTYNTVAKIEVLTVGGSGEVLTASIDTAGDYQVIPSDPVGQASVAPAGGSGATFNLTFEGGDRHVILEGSGGGSDEIIVGWRTFSDVPGDYYNLELHGMTGYTASLPMDEQPGVSNGWYEEPLAADYSGSYLVATSVSFNYFININPYRIIITVAVGSVRNHSYIGWGNRLGTASELPYPLIIAGSASRPEITTGEVIKHSSLVDPWAIASGDEGPMRIYGADGTWYAVRNRGSTTPLSDRCVIPAQRPGAVAASPSLPEDRFMGQGLDFADIIYALSSGSGGAVAANVLPAGASDHRIMLPAIIVFSSPSPQVLAELDEVFWCSAFGGVTNEDRYIDSDGIAYRIFQNCNRTDSYAYIAIKEAS